MNGHYWIDAKRMEPSQITYRLHIELDAKPISFKTFENICGDTVQYADRYPSPSRLARDLNLDFDRFNIDQPVGEHSEWYRITSWTTYYQEASAAEQAQKAWDQSQILEQFKAGKICRVRFGNQEVETGFVFYLGSCEEPGRLWNQPVSRSVHMEQQALQESLCLALDVNDFRDYLGLFTESINDQRLLQIMHESRESSKYLAEEARRESKIWLAQHEPLD